MIRSGCYGDVIATIRSSVWWEGLGFSGSTTIVAVGLELQWFGCHGNMTGSTVAMAMDSGPFLLFQTVCQTGVYCYSRVVV